MVAAMMRRSLLGAMVSLVLALVPALVGAGELQVRVLASGQIPAPVKIPVTIDQYVCGTEKERGDLLVSPAREVRNVVAWLQNPPPGAPTMAVSGNVQMDQKECVFTPRIVLVPHGATVEFLNSDRLLHNLHSVPKENASFNRTQPKGRTIPISFARPEFVRIDCDLHSWMRGWVVVAEHPYYAITDAQGRVRFDNLPAGSYTLQLWHERLGTASRTVTVTDGASPVTVELPIK
jgi:plastocyanin